MPIYWWYGLSSLGIGKRRATCWNKLQSEADQFDGKELVSGATVTAPGDAEYRTRATQSVGRSCADRASTISIEPNQY
jgi:hypothetical protein